MTFNDLKLAAPLLRAVAALGYEHPTPVQEKSIPAVLSGRDVLIKSRTGTGKTASFGLPALQRLLPKPGKDYRLLAIAPTRELADQLHADLRDMARGTGLRGVLVTGGDNIRTQEHRVRLGGDWVVATPGRLKDLLNRGAVDFESLKILVLDEADRLLEMGFMPDIRDIISRLPADRQTMLLSATLPKEIRELAKAILRNPETIDVVGKDDSAEGLTAEVWPVAARQKVELFEAMHARGEIPNGTIVFVRTRIKCRKLAKRLAAAGFPARAMHGDLGNGERRSALAAFRNGTAPFLVATDLAARGLDIDSVACVVNFDAPATPEDYIHRVGRTARAGRSGRAVTFLSHNELPLLAGVEKALGRRIVQKRLDGFEYEEDSEAALKAHTHQHHRRPHSFNQRTITPGPKESPFTKTGAVRRGFEAGAVRKAKPKKVRNKRLPHQR